MQPAWLGHTSVVVVLQPYEQIGIFEKLMFLEEMKSLERKLESIESNCTSHFDQKWKKIQSNLVRISRLVLGFEIWDFLIFKLKTSFNQFK